MSKRNVYVINRNNTFAGAGHTDTGGDCTAFFEDVNAPEVFKTESKSFAVAHLEKLSETIDMTEAHIEQRLLSVPWG